MAITFAQCVISAEDEVDASDEAIWLFAGLLLRKVQKRKADHKILMPSDENPNISVRSSQKRLRRELRRRFWLNVTPRFTVVGRQPNTHRDREHVLDLIHRKSDATFERHYRLNRRDFYDLLSKISPRLQRYRKMAELSSGSYVEPEIRLAVTLRFLAGGSYIDIGDAYNVDHDTLSAHIVWPTCEAIDEELQNIVFPIQDSVALAEIERGWFAVSHGRLAGTVGAIDGLVVRTRRPYHKEVDGNVLVYRNRKGCWGIVVQGVCDSRGKFLYISATCPGSTFDSTAFELTDLFRQLSCGQLNAAYHMIGDEAYINCEWMLTP